MLEIIIPFVIIAGIVLTKLSALRSSVLVILSEMTHFLSGLIDLRQDEASSPSSSGPVDGWLRGP
jgi:hypothetical protein